MEAIVLAIGMLAVFALGLLAAGAAWLYESAITRATDYKVCLSDLFLNDPFVFMVSAVDTYGESESDSLN